MMYWNYDRLTEITSKNPPFRGTPNKFPWDYKRRSAKCIYVRKEGDDTVFDITYYEKQNNEPISKEVYDNYVSSGQSEYVRMYRNHYTNEDVHIFVTRHPSVLGTVRSDNTFEFTNKSYGHGDNIMLSNHSAGYFSICSRMGGLIYSQGHSMLPVYQGMRVDCNTMRPTKDFSVFVKNVDRSKSKALVKSYEKLFKVSETMFKAMDHASFKASAREVITDIDNYVTHWGKADELFTKGFGLIEESPFDAMTYMILGLNTNYCLSTLAEQATTPGNSKYEPHALYVSAKKSILKELYRRNPIFTEREFKAGETYPASTWGITLRVDGKEVEQCY